MSGSGTLDAWVGRTIGVARLPTRDDIDAYQLRCLNETIAYARSQSPFYRLRTDWPEPCELVDLSDIARLPLTTADDLVRGDPSLIALPMRDAVRLVTIPTSGTSGRQKRLFFTEADIEATVAYFEHGMATIVRPGSSVAVAFPAQRPDSVGDLLMRGLTRLGAFPAALPVDGSLDRMVDALRELRPAAIAGMPVTLGAAARRMETDGGLPLRIETALVSADSVSPSFKAALAVVWGAEAFEHWGMTETGYGGALACEAHDGLHVRETDLYLEIVDGSSGRPLPAGQEGEIVVTTLRRRGLPLIRYRTGDGGRIIDDRCRCGSVLRRLRLGGRIGEPGAAGGGGRLPAAIIDDAIFAVDGVIDFSVELRTGRGARLAVGVMAAAPRTIVDVRAALLRHPIVGPWLQAAGIDLAVERVSGPPFSLCRKRRVTVVCGED
ncbi:Phenylacetate-coenzyme A ligase [uncultured Pleomorphomonas sp.]|uniref:Phenylacetate-coenzyme A ligase n=1 Tax=uncultured Pleomorphomonas sp. TaxID=442121 RepID=A0A212L048_9HYPH|nr:AMP-binding protein [uncultured Pleomorphomonas sp.]SCM70941.1 Phenylacetate-coenzyme A ligase [uncultured Pleomorphomonas sp.]